jgi:selT/selW/selH-like putative selenoprotein
VTVSRERFEQGMTYAAYRAQMTQNQERFAETERTLVLDPADIAFFQGLTRPIHVAVLAEDWCGDVINNLPVLGRLEQFTDKLVVRVFLRDQNLDLMDQYLKEGQYRSIPVFVFLDADFNELGFLIERPAQISALMGEAMAKVRTEPVFDGIPPETSFGELPEAARERLREAWMAFRAETREVSDRELVREFRSLIGRAGGAHPAVAPIHVPMGANSQPAWQRSGQPTVGKPVKVSITYCAHCGYEPQTLSLAQALMLEFRSGLAALELLPWQDGTFDVVVDGELVHSMERDGGFPEPATLIDAVRTRMAAEPA